MKIKILDYVSLRSIVRFEVNLVSPRKLQTYLELIECNRMQIFIEYRVIPIAMLII